MTKLHLPCGGEALFDHSSGCSYRCMDCLTTVGSVSMPRECKSEMDKYDKVLPALGSNITWDYENGCETERKVSNVAMG